MRQSGLEALFEKTLPIARLAGKAVMEVYLAGKVGVLQKADLSPVTEADMAAHRVLVSQLDTLLPSCPVVSEESEASHTHRHRATRFWLIDPLDGTKEFIAGCSEFTVNIALIDEGRSLLGIVYAPAIDVLYWGGPEIGAFRAVGSESSPIKVGGAIAGECRVVASKSHLNAETKAFINRLGPVRLVQTGSSLKLCCVAEGGADIYPRLAPTCEWDTAAAQAILEGAGGAVVNLEGAPLLYGKPDVLNPSFIATRDPALIPA